LDFKYGTATGKREIGESLFGGNGTKLGSTDEATNGLYGEGRYGYSVNERTGSTVSGSATQIVSPATWENVGYISELSASAAAGRIFKVAVPASSFAPGADFEAVRSFQVSGSGVAATINQFHSISGSLGDKKDGVFFYVSASDAASIKNLTIKYSSQPTDFNRGDFEDKNPPNGTKDNNPLADVGIDRGQDLNIPEIDLELRSEAIVAKTRKLKAVWTPELAQDLNAYHSIDAEAELTSMLSDYISLEIDLEILDMLKNNALTVDYWSAQVGEELDPISKTWDIQSGALAYQKNTWFQTLGIKLNKVSNKIHQLTLRGGANFVVASPDVCTILESIPGFTTNAEKDSMRFAAGVTQVGSLSNRYTVYKNPYMTSNEILMGYRGNNFLETGAVYAPYVPLIMTPLVYDPQNFTPRRGVMTRYAKKLVRPEYYGKIYIKDLNSL